MPHYVSELEVGLECAEIAADGVLTPTPGGSMQTTVEITKDAAEAGASHALVICPGT